MSMFKNSAKTLLKAVFPKTCKLCGEVIELDSDYCERCSKIKRIENPRCPYCGASVKDCSCKKHKKDYKAVIAPYYYSGSIKNAIYNFKSKRMTFLADSLAAEMTACIKENYSDIAFDFVTFIPLRRFHEFVRGFNQAELLAKRIAHSLGIPCYDTLYKAMYTGVQHKKTAQNRAASVYGAYDVYKEYSDLTGKTILIIDDVKTTGSTLMECSKMLKLYGADSVYACTFAVTNNPKKKNNT